MSDYRYAFVLEGGADSTFTVTVMQNDHMSIEVNHPWDGDTERGFGNTAYWYLSRDDARRLRDYLTAQLAEQATNEA